MNQIIQRAVVPEGIVDIFAAAGLKKPNISILSDEFLGKVQKMKQRNLAIELLKKLIKNELSVRRRKNIVQSRSFAEMLERTIRRYQNRSIEAATVIKELIKLAKEIREAAARGEELGLSEDELAFYDALETNDSAVKILGDDTLHTIAQELVETVQGNLEIDWMLRESVRAKLRVLVKSLVVEHHLINRKTQPGLYLSRQNCCQPKGQCKLCSNGHNSSASIWGTLSQPFSKGIYEQEVVAIRARTTLHASSRLGAHLDIHEPQTGKNFTPPEADPDPPL